MTPAAVDQGVVEVAASALDRVAAALPPGHALILAVCDAAGRPSDLLVRDPDGRVVVLAGVAEERRPDLGALIGIGGDELERTASEPEAPGAPQPTRSGGGDALLMRTILERAPVPLMLVDSNGTIAYAPASMDDFGFRTKELLGHRLADFAHPDDRERLVRLLDLLRRDERAASSIDIRWRQRDESYTPVEITIRAGGDPPALSGGGVVVALRSLPRPGADPVELIAAARRHRVLADASDCGVAIVSGVPDTIGTVLDANAALGRLVGTPTGQLIGTSLSSLVADSEVGRIRPVLEATRSRGEPHTLEVAIAEPPGGGRRAVMTITADVGDTGSSDLLVRVHDITEQRRLIAELSGSVDRLTRTDREFLGEAIARVVDTLAGEIARLEAGLGEGP